MGAGPEERTRGLVLVVEDEPAIADVIRMNVTRAGYGVLVHADGGSALAMIASARPIALILDINLPGMDGIEICRRLRAEENWTPILFVTARDDEADRIVGLELGADDYIAKPFSPRELVARLGSVLRRVQGAPAGGTVALGRLRLDINSRRAYADDIEVDLTATEFDLVAALIRQPDRVLTRDQLLAAVWGYNAAGGTRTVDVHIAQVRAKLGEASPIRTVRGVGYAASATR